MRYIYQYCSCSVIALVLTSSPAWADEVGAQAAPSAGQEAAEPVKNEIVVTAQRREERAVNVPISLVVASGDTLEDRGVVNIQQIDRIAPGVMVTTTSGYLQPVIRGYASTATSAGEDNPVALYVDNVYIPAKLGGLIDLPDVDRMEILKGPQGSLYGRNAAAGAIVIHTITPSLNEVTGKIDASVGVYAGKGAQNASALRGKMFVTFPIARDKLALSISAAGQRAGRYVRDISTDVNTGLNDSFLLRTKLLLQASDDLRFTATGAYSKGWDGVNIGRPFSGLSIASLFPDAIIATGPWQIADNIPARARVQRTEFKAVTLGAELDVDGFGAIEFNGAYTDSHNEGQTDLSKGYSPTCAQLFACGAFDAYRNDDETWQANLNISTERFGPVEFVGGASFYRAKGNFAGNIFPDLQTAIVGKNFDHDAVPIFGRPIGTVTTKAWAVYLQGSLELVERLHLSAGGRYSNEKKTGFGTPNAIATPFQPVPTPFRSFPSTGPLKEDAFTPNASLRYEITPYANVYFTYSKGFKTGIINGTNSDDQFSLPEKVESYELGFKYSYNRVSFSIAAFHNKRNDIQIFYNSGPLNIFSNAGSGKTQGIDFDLSAEVARGLTLRANGSWLPTAKYTRFPNGQVYAPYSPGAPFVCDAAGCHLETVQFDAAGRRLLRAPRLSGTFGVDYQFDTSSGPIDVNMNASYVSTFNWDLLGLTQTKAKTIFDGRLTWTPNDGNIKLGIYGTNLTNAKRITGTELYASAVGAIFSPPREIGIFAGYTF